MVLMPPPLLEAVAQVLRRDSRLGSGAAPTLEYLMDLLYYGEFDIFEQVSSTEADDFVNLVGVKGAASDKAPLWLVSCVTTGHDPTPNQWSRGGSGPLEPLIDPTTGVVRGLGVASGKVDLVLKIMAASRFFAEELTRPVAVLALFGTEARATGLRGVLLDHPRPGMALVHAPTSLELWTDSPGLVVLELALDRRVRHRRMPPTLGMYRVELEGRSAHAQAPSLGDDALTQVDRALELLRGPGEIRLLSIDAGEGAERIAGRATLQVATAYDEPPPPIPSGRWSALPDGASVPFPIDDLHKAWRQAVARGLEAVGTRFAAQRNPRSARPRQGTHLGWLRSERDRIAGSVAFWTGPGASVEEQVERFGEAVTRSLERWDEMSAEIRVLQDRPAFSGRETAAPLLGPARAALGDIGIPPVVSGGRLTSDAGLLALHGVPTLAFGAGRGAPDLHVDDASVPILHLEKAAQFYENLIRRLCTTPAEGT